LHKLILQSIFLFSFQPESNHTFLLTINIFFYPKEADNRASTPQTSP